MAARTKTKRAGIERKETISTTFSPPLIAAMDFVAERWNMSRAKLFETALLELFERLPPDDGGSEVQKLLEQHDPALALRKALRRQR